MRGLAKRLLFVIGPEHKLRLLRVLCLSVIVAILEFLSIGSLFPLFTIMFGQSKGSNSHLPAVASLSRIGLDPTNPSFLAEFAGILTLLFIVKAALTAYALETGFRFTYDVQVSIGSRMLRATLRRDYPYFLSQQTTVLLKNLTTEISFLAGGVLIPSISIFTQGLIVLTVALLLAWVSPAMALIAFTTVAVLTGTLFAMINRKLTVWGREREKRFGEMSALVHQSFSGIKTVKAMTREEPYLQEFEKLGQRYATLNTRYQTAAAAPPLLIELVLFGGITGVMFYYGVNHYATQLLLPALGLFGVSAYRILPAARRIFSDMVTIRYYGPSFSIVETELRNELGGVLDQAMDPQLFSLPLAALSKSIRLEGVGYRYPGADKDVLTDVNLAIQAGSQLAIVGGSGAGKTTVVDILMGLLEPTQGSLLIDGVRVERSNSRSWLSQIGYVSQQVFLTDGTLRDNILFGAAGEDVDERRLEDVVRQAHLSALVRTLRNGLDTSIGENGIRLSGGERQRIAIARALYRAPRLLILDEATSALDVLTEQALNAEVLGSCAGITVVIVSHRLSTVQDCAQLAFMSNGTVVEIGTYEQLTERAPEFAEMHRQSQRGETLKPDLPALDRSADVAARESGGDGTSGIGVAL